MVKVAHVINDLGVGGAQRIVVDLVTGLDRTRFEPVVFNLNYRKDESFAREIIDAGIPVINLPAMFKGDPLVLLPLTMHFKKGKFDIVHTHLFWSGFWGGLAARLAGVRITISTEHNTSTFDTKPPIYRWLAGQSLRRMSRILAISNAVKKSIVDALPALAEKTAVVYNGINLDSMTPVERNSDRKQFVVGTVMRDDPRKGFDVFERCAQLSSEAGLPIIFKAGMSGKGPASRFVSVESINGRKKVFGFLDKLNIFVLPSHEEGLGLAAIEAMARGIPVIVSDAGGLPEVVQHGTDGLVFASGNAHALFDSVRTLFHDPDLAQKLAAAAFKKAQKFSLKNMINNIERHYSELLENEQSI